MLEIGSGGDLCNTRAISLHAVTDTCYNRADERHGEQPGPARHLLSPVPLPPTMDTQLYAALLALGILVIGSIGAIVKALTDRVLKLLAVNTQITTEAADAADGRLQTAQRELAKERDRSFALRELVRERDNRLAYIVSRLPQAEALMSEYGRRREDRHTKTEEQRVLTRLLEDYDDPTGSDAGRFRPH